MALPILQITVDTVTISAIIGLVVREIVKNKKEKKDPGNGKETNGILNEIRKSIKVLEEKSVTMDKNYAVIARGMEAWEERCGTHLEGQATINLEVKNRLESLDGRIFNIINKD